MTCQWGAVFGPLIAQASAAGRNAELRRSGGAVSKTGRRAGGGHIFIDGETGAVGDCVAANTTDNHTVNARIGRTDIVQSKAAASLAGERNAIFEPLVIQAAAAS